MIEKLDDIILFTSRIYDLYIDLIECELSFDKNKFESINEKLKMCLEVEQNMYDRLHLDKNKFIELLKLLNVDNSAYLSFPYYYGEYYKVVKSPLIFEMEYIYTFLFYSQNEQLSGNVGYHELLEKTYIHPILRRIIFNLYQSFYRSKNYEAFVFNDYLKYINAEYINRGSKILIAREKYHSLEELFLETSSNFTLEFLKNIKCEIRDYDNYLYVCMKYILAFINKNTETKLLKIDCLGKDRDIKIPSPKYNEGTTQVYEYYTFKIAIENIMIMIEMLFHEKADNNNLTDSVSFKMVESLLEICFKTFNETYQKDLLEELNKLKEQSDDIECKEIIDKICKNKQLIYK